VPPALYGIRPEKETRTCTIMGVPVSVNETIRPGRILFNAITLHPGDTSETRWFVHRELAEAFCQDHDLDTLLSWKHCRLGRGTDRFDGRTFYSVSVQSPQEDFPRITDYFGCARNIFYHIHVEAPSKKTWDAFAALLHTLRFVEFERN
ncbi:MAG TPA: hypothetical protein VFU15_08875, partial [Bacteroidia bacterium]|nr:hypothetical protein [Bacteroidia bacterium]